MAVKKEIKEVIQYMILAFPNYNPDLESTPNVIDVLYSSFQYVSHQELFNAVVYCTEEPGRRYAPSIGEIFQAIYILRTKDIKPAHQVIEEMGLNDVSDEEQKIKNQKILEERGLLFDGGKE